MSSASTPEYIGTELALFALARNWKRYWSSAIKPLLGSNVLEVGAGIGSNLQTLHSGQHWTALEPDSEQCRAIEQMCISNSTFANVRVLNGVLRDLQSDEKFDSIIYIDVLEHIEDDRGELEVALQHLTENGKLIVLSPAHQSLYSPFDESVGHYRRYNKDSIRAIRPTNCVISKLFYMDSVGMFASLANAKLMKKSMPSPQQIKIWDKLMVPISKVLDPVTGHNIGKTIVAIFENRKL